MPTFKTAQLDPFSLSGAGAVLGATSVILKSFQTIDGVNLAMSDFGTIGYGTLEPGNGVLEEQISFSGVTQNSNGTATLTGVKSVLFISPYTETSGLSKTHAGSTTFVISNTSGFYNQFPAKGNDEIIDGQWTFTNTPITPPAVSNASTTVKGVTKLSVAPVSSANPIAVGDNDVRVPTADPTTLFAPLNVSVTGSVNMYAGSSTPTGYLPCDGTAVSRSTYSALFSAISTTWGVGDGSTTFNVPDLRGRMPMGTGTGTKIATIASITGNVFTVTGLTNTANNEFQTGEPVVFTAVVPGNLINATTYYVVRTGNLTFSLATTLANAQNASVITLAGTETGTFTLTLTARSLGNTGGEENHAMSVTEILSHSHTVNGNQNGSGSALTSTSVNNSVVTPTSTVGGNAAMNVMNPFAALTFIIKT